MLIPKRSLFVLAFLTLGAHLQAAEVTIDFQHGRVFAEDHDARLVEYVRSTLANKPPLVPPLMPDESMASTRILDLKQAMDRVDPVLSAQFDIQPQFTAVFDERPVDILGIPIFSQKDPPGAEITQIPLPGPTALFLGCIDPTRLRSPSADDSVLEEIEEAKRLGFRGLENLTDDQLLSMILRPKVVVAASRPSDAVQAFCSKNGRHYVRFAVGRMGSRVFVNQLVSIPISDLSRIFLWGGNKPERLRSEATRTYTQRRCVDLVGDEAEEALATGNYDERPSERIVGEKVVLVPCRYEPLEVHIDDAIFGASSYAKMKSTGSRVVEGVRANACDGRFGHLPDDLNDLAALVAAESAWTILLCDKRPAVSFLAVGLAAQTHAAEAFCWADAELGPQLRQFSPSDENSTELAFQNDREAAAYLDIMPVIFETCSLMRPQEATSAQSAFLSDLSSRFLTDLDFSALDSDLARRVALATAEAIDGRSLTWLAYPLGLLESLCKSSADSEPCATLRRAEETAMIQPIDEWRHWPDRSNNPTAQDGVSGIDVSAPVFVYVAAEDLFSTQLDAVLSKLLVRKRNSGGEIVWPALARNETITWNVDFDIFQTPVFPFEHDPAIQQ
ncbi:hypothetical protein [Rhizobium indigoferae]|uniref:Uncharacterized protein n=1 Tax=Rhizobium indigoferae TaxID=158891 RepID=A0ABZ0ZIQ7_9HYPH|nr:hypothetical protein [Rhizobium indigoferae]NNU57601.1 hypothetical protein [Rhizobium indigoferae]WQN39519.1 hypothetical protein U5G49_004723 [Rhizobium indigoferae]GLR60804.1 hypothetical protein GCM10007919_55330 [Rhizobium indigoferae]